MNHARSDTTRVLDPSGEGMIQDGPTEFEARLAFRTKVPAERLHEFLDWPIYKLRRESEHVSRVLKRIAEAVVNSMENPASTNAFLRDLDLKSISRDHDWRAIFSTIRTHEGGYDGYKRTVLIRYLQYLSFRKRLLEYIHTRKRGYDDEESNAEELTGYPSPPPMATPGTGFADTDGPVSEDGLRRFTGDFRRMPLGEALELPMGTAGKLDIMLAGHLFRIIGGHPPSLIDQNGVTYFLKDGRNMVGRHPESDVPIDQNFSDVSRAHVIVEWEGNDQITLIDLSSRGCFIRNEILERALTLDTPHHAFDLPGWQLDDKEEVTIN
jgi:hypothetical protein